MTQFYVDDALHHQPADEERVNEALASLNSGCSTQPRQTAKNLWSYNKLVIDCITA
ncbi:hypothetical protein ACLK17_06075 [Escherichia coli]